MKKSFEVRRVCLTVLFATCHLCVGCDSEPEAADPDVLGTWKVVALSDGGGDLTDVLNAAFHTVQFKFQVGGGFTWFQDGVNDLDDDTITGSFSLSATTEDSGRIRVTLQDGGFFVQLDFDLTVLETGRIRLATDADAFNEVRATEFAGTLTITLERI